MIHRAVALAPLLAAGCLIGGQIGHNHGEDGGVGMGVDAPPPVWTLSVERTGEGTVSSTPPRIECGATCSAQFPDGVTVPLSATPAPGHAFGGWTGECSGAGGCVVEMTADRHVGASFLPRPGFAVRIGGPGVDGVTSLSIAPDGSLLLGGWFYGSADLGGGTITGAGSDDGFVARYAADGTWLESASFGGTLADRVADLTLDGEGGYFVVGTFEGVAALGAHGLVSAGSRDGFVAHVSGAGSVDWALGLGGAGQDAVTSVAVAGTGYVLVGGEFEGVLDAGVGPPMTSNGARDLFLAWVSVGGALEAVQRLGGEGDDHLASLAVDGPTGDIAIVGSFDTRTDLGCGETNSSGYTDAFIVRLAAGGTVRYCEEIGSAPAEGLFGVDFDLLGNTVMGGTAGFPWGWGGLDLLVGEQTATSERVYRLDLGGPQDDRGLALTLDPSDHLLVVGDFVGTADLGTGPLVSASGLPDAFVAEYGPAGTPIASWSFGGPGADHATAVAAAAGSTFVAGGFEGTALFPAGELTSSGAADGFLVRIDP